MTHDKEFIAAVASDDPDEDIGPPPMPPPLDPPLPLCIKSSREGADYALATPAPVVYSNAPEDGRPPLGITGFYKDADTRQWCPVFAEGAGTPAEMLDSGGMRFDIPEPGWVPDSMPISYVKDEFGLEIPVYALCPGEVPMCKDDDIVSDAGSDHSIKSVPAGGMAPRHPDNIAVDEQSLADNWALAAKTRDTKAKLEALAIAAKWLVDTGCGKDLVPMRIAQQYVDFFGSGGANDFWHC